MLAVERRLTLDWALVRVVDGVESEFTGGGGSGGGDSAGGRCGMAPTFGASVTVLEKSECLFFGAIIVAFTAADSSSSTRLDFVLSSKDGVSCPAFSSAFIHMLCSS